jgi:outer membrane protein assembly factor BamB
MAHPVFRRLVTFRHHGHGPVSLFPSRARLFKGGFTGNDALDLLFDIFNIFYGSIFGNHYRRIQNRSPMKTLIQIQLAAWVGMFPFHVAVEAQTDDTVHWPQFRGPNASGIATNTAPPATWDSAEGMRIQWKTAIPGLGHSSPVIWGGRLFVTTAVSTQDNPTLKLGLYGNITPVKEDTPHQWRLFCLDTETGDILWEQTAQKGVPEVQRHPKSTHANSTPATDGRRVVAFYGSEGLFCYDMEGELLWDQGLWLLDSGYYRMSEAQWGCGSSPIIVGEKVIVQMYVQEGAVVAAYDSRNGKELWRTRRDEVPTWCTPTIAPRGDGHQVIVNGYRHVGGYDLATGKELWKLSGGGDIPVPTPVVAHGLAFICSAHGRESPMYAIRLDAQDDISLEGNNTSNMGVAWSNPRNGAYMQTPLVYGDYLYSCRDTGVLKCYRVKTGELIYEERLGTGGSGFTASPVAADDKLYFTSEQGEVYVVEPGPELKVLATNSLGETCMATPAIADDVIYFRTRRHVLAIGER